MPADLPVAAPDHAETIKHGRAHVEFLGMYVDTEQAVEELEAVCDLADALLAERQQDKQRIERLETALSVYADPRHWAISRDDLAMRVVSWIGPGATTNGPAGRDGNRSCRSC